MRVPRGDVIVEGAEVCMRSAPLYESGTKVVLLNNAGAPKIGQLVHPMYNIADSFEVKGIVTDVFKECRRSKDPDVLFGKHLTLCTCRHNLWACLWSYNLLQIPSCKYLLTDCTVFASCWDEA